MIVLVVMVSAVVIGWGIGQVMGQQRQPAGPRLIPNLYSLANYPLARCLDGSPAAYYFTPGYNTSRFEIMLQGTTL